MKTGRPCKSVIPDHKAEIVASLRAGESYREIASRLHVGRDLLRYYAIRWGEASRAGNGPPIEVEHQGRTITLYALAEEIGIDYLTLYYRYRAGDRGKRLIRKVKRAPKPKSYALGISLARWHEYVDLAREIGADNVARKTGIPRGAVNAAVRGEWHRLE